jgi:hypothetical protein
MKRSMKVALISTTLILLFGATVLGFVGSQSAAANGSPPNNRPPDNRPPATRGLTDNDLKIIKELLEQERTDNLSLTRIEILKRLLANATTVQINGKVVALVTNKLVLNTTTGHETILLPRIWTVDSQVMRRAQLFNGTFSAIGQNVTVKALQLTLFENQNIIINILFGFEITNTNSVTAFALLPFNIETKT